MKSSTLLYAAAFTLLSCTQAAPVPTPGLAVPAAEAAPVDKGGDGDPQYYSPPHPCDKDQQFGGSPWNWLICGLMKGQHMGPDDKHHKRSLESEPAPPAPNEPGDPWTWKDGFNQPCMNVIRMPFSDLICSSMAAYGGKQCCPN